MNNQINYMLEVIVNILFFLIIFLFIELPYNWILTNYLELYIFLLNYGFVKVNSKYLFKFSEDFLLFLNELYFWELKPE
jgi:hypothetical protein